MSNASIPPRTDTNVQSPFYRYESVPCPRCGTDRIIRGYGDLRFQEARTRMCRSCAVQHMLASRRPPEVDWVVLDRLLSGRPTRANTAEKFEAVRILTERGYPSALIATLLHTTQRSICRRRSLLRARGQLGPYRDNEVA